MINTQTVSYDEHMTIMEMLKDDQFEPAIQAYLDQTKSQFPSSPTITLVSVDSQAHDEGIVTFSIEGHEPWGIFFDPDENYQKWMEDAMSYLPMAQLEGLLNGAPERVVRSL